MPPPEGYGAFKYKRSLPFKGPSGLAVVTALGLITGFGWYQQLGMLHEREALKREENQHRVNLLPFLYAERDRDAYRRQAAALAREAEIMKNVPGWEVGKLPYHTKRYVAPTVIV